MMIPNSESKKDRGRKRLFRREPTHGEADLRNELEKLEKQQQQHLALLESQKQAIAGFRVELAEQRSKTTRKWEKGCHPPSTQIIVVLFALTSMVMMMMISMNGTLKQLAGSLLNDNHFNIDQAIYNASTLVDKPSTTSESVLSPKTFMAEVFPSYKAAIDKQMEEEYPPADKSTLSLLNCSTPFVKTEFGKELRAIVPWAYKRQEECERGVVHTSGVIGSRYMYFFSNDHFIDKIDKTKRRGGKDGKNVPRATKLKSRFAQVAKGNPFGDTVYGSEAPKEHWKPPPFADFFGRPKFFESLLRGKPLVVILNKYAMELTWDDDKPVNYFDKNTLREVLTYLTPTHTVLYKRTTPETLKDWHEKSKLKVKDLNEKPMIRSEFPDVLMMEDFSDELTDPEDFNLLQFGFMSKASKFLTVQGGTAVVGSYFGGTNIILIKKGRELKTHDYNYFPAFSNATVVETHTEAEFLKKMRSLM